MTSREVLGLAVLAGAAWIVWSRSSAAPSPASPQPGTGRRPVRPVRPAPRRTSSPATPKPSESDPAFVAALARWQATQVPGFVGISYGRPFWRWTGYKWTVAQAV